MVLGLDTNLKRVIFAAYVLLWVSSHVLVYSSRLAGAPVYNATSVVLVTEVLKLALALMLYLLNDATSARSSRMNSRLSQFVSHIAMAPDLPFKYAAPALLYCVYNNLVYVNLTTFDPGTYNVLMQLRIVFTGLLYQVIFSRRLNRNQWCAIACITIGCIMKESEKISLAQNVQGALRASLVAWLLLFVQMLCSVTAGVYNEVLLKDRGRIPTNLQNGYLYFNSVLCNFGVLLAQGKLGEALAMDNLRTICTPTLIMIILVMSSVGLVTGFFLRHLDSVLKAVASALEVVASMFISYAVFGVAFGPQALIAGLLVGSAVALYSRPIRAAKAHGYVLTSPTESNETLRLLESGNGR